jgi:putrescine aminotransferase
MAAVCATLETMRREGIPGRAASLGRTITESVRSILEECCPSLVVEVRGAGLLIGVEFKEDYIAADFTFELLRRRVILSNSLNSFRVARFTPSALLSAEELAWLFDAVRGAAIALNKRYAGEAEKKG